MKDLRNLAATTLLALVSAGCLRFELKVFVNRDGTGTVVERVLYDVEAFTLGSEQSKKLPLWTLRKRGAKDRAKAMHTKLVSVEVVEEIRGDRDDGPKAWKGFEARYGFDDVRTVKPNVSLLQFGDQPTEAARLSFALAGDRLFVTLPERPVDESLLEQGSGMMFGGGRFPEAVGVHIQIHVEGRSAPVDLVRVETRQLNSALNDPTLACPADPKISLLTQACATGMGQVRSYADRVRLANRVPGVFIETEERVTVSFSK